jgi:hypothetical protein
MVDNGAGLTPASSVPIYMQATGGGTNACSIVGGEILTAGGAGLYGIQLYGMKHVMIENIDFTFSSWTGAGGSCVFLGNSTSACTVQGCTPPSSGYLVNVDATSTYNLAVANTRDAGAGQFNNSGGATNVLTPS